MSFSEWRSQSGPSSSIPETPVVAIAVPHNPSYIASASDRPVVLEDEILNLRIRLAGNWTKLQTANTLSGRPDSQKSYCAYLYARRMIIREWFCTPPPTPGDPPGVLDILAVKQHRVRCCHCDKVWGPYTPTHTTTSHYIRHFQKHHSQLPENEDKERAFIRNIELDMLNDCTSIGKKRQRTDTNPWTLSSERFKFSTRQPGQFFEIETYRKLLTRFIVETNSAFSLVEAKSFRDLLQYCNSRAIPISSSTLIRDLGKLHAELLPSIKARLARHTTNQGYVNLTLDAWTSTNKVPYLGITVHWMDDQFILHDCVLAFRRLRGSHTGQNLAGVVYKVLQEFDLVDFLHCITSDNASVNDRLFLCLQNDHLPSWLRKDGQIRCMAHIINLAAQKILKHLKGEADIPEVILAEDDAVILREDISPATVLKKVRRIISKIRASNIYFESLEREAIAIQLKFLKPMLDVKVRWNSTFMMLQRFIYLGPAIDRLIAFEPKLAGFQLSEPEWDILKRLAKVLSIFLNATTHLSGKRYPTMQLQLPYYEILLRKLHSAREEEARSQDRALYNACDEAWKLLNTYWNKTDSQSAPAIALLLDPRCKTATLRQLGWTQPYINTAVANFRRVYEKQYAPRPIAGSRPVSPQANRPDIDGLEPEIDENSLQELLFGPENDLRGVEDELDEPQQYLDEAKADRKVDVATWWKLHAHRLPNLARMARDYMAIPASSVPSEQLFSRAGDIITKKRNRLEASAPALLLTKSWLGLPEVEAWELEEEDDEGGWAANVMDSQF